MKPSHTPAWWRLFAVEWSFDPHHADEALRRAHPDMPPAHGEAEVARVLSDPGFGRILRQMATRAAGAYRMTLEQWWTARLDLAKRPAADLDATAERRTLEIVGQQRGFLPVRPDWINLQRQGDKMDIPNQPSPTSRATPAPAKRGRTPVLTPERRQIIVTAIANGSTEKAARLKAGVSGAAFYAAKKRDAEFASNLERARLAWAAVQGNEHLKRVEAMRFRRGGGKLKQPAPTYQANLVVLHLVRSIPLETFHITSEQEREACEKFGLSWELWCSQRDRFDLIGQIQRKRGELRTRHQAENRPPPMFRPPPKRRPTLEEVLGADGGRGNW